MAIVLVYANNNSLFQSVSALKGLTIKVLNTSIVDIGLFNFPFNRKIQMSNEL